MEEGFAPVTRFNTTAPAPGCTNCTADPWPIEKLCQLMTARSLPCVMRCWVGLTFCMVAVPRATVPPAGTCAAGWPGTSATAAMAAIPACRSAAATGVNSNPALRRLR